MPYKEKEMKTQRQRERRLKPLQSEAPIIEAPKSLEGYIVGIDEGVTQKGVTPHNDYSASQETVPASYVPGTDGKQYEMLPERPRYLTLSDEQVLDRANQPVATGALSANAMLRANDSCFGYVPNVKPLPASLRGRFK